MAKTEGADLAAKWPIIGACTRMYVVILEKHEVRLLRCRSTSRYTSMPHLWALCPEFLNN
jgi:hypothetical protein